ncbi:MAG TPA: GIY-YIG nuclease family protein [Ignavibacteria bacterium]
MGSVKSKKEIKEEYKQKVFKKGVFQIRNIKSGKIYIGSSTNLDVVWNSHKFRLETGIHPDKELQIDWNESGSKNFVYEILQELKESGEPSVDYDREVRGLEALCIEELKSFGNKIYNK